MAEQRMAEIRAQKEEEQMNKVLGHGDYREITEQEFLPTVTKTQYCVCHFFHKDFERCKIVDMHLRKICKEHLECRFISLNAEKAPFFIQKLQIQVLPTIIMFDNGIAVDRVVGFEELGGTDEFPTLTLTRRLIRGGVLEAKTKREKGQIKINKKGRG
jgi:thioredoxin-like negative regulator of GroEL